MRTNEVNGIPMRDHVLRNPRPIPTALLLAVLAVLVSGLLTAPAAGASARGWTLCGGPEVLVKGEAAVIDDVAAQNLSCRAAAKVIKRCIRNSKVPGWRASMNAAGSLMLRKRHTRTGVAGRMMHGGAPLCLAAKIYAPIPSGTTYLMRRDPAGNAYGYAFYRSGHRVRYAWRYTAGAPLCFKGRIIPGGIRGVAVSLYWDEHPRHRETKTVRAGRTKWLVNGEKYRVVSPDDTDVIDFLDSVYHGCKPTWAELA